MALEEKRTLGWEDVIVEEEIVEVSGSDVFPLYTQSSWTASFEGFLYEGDQPLYQVKFSRSAGTAEEAANVLRKAAEHQGWSFRE